MRALVIVGVAIAAGAAAYGWWLPPHDRYAMVMQVRALTSRDDGADARRWLSSARSSLDAADSQSAPFAASGDLGAGAAAWRFPARRGQRIAVSMSPADGIFVDLFRDDGRTRATGGTSPMTYDAADDGALVLRVQGPLHARGAYRVETRVEPSLLFPVPGVSAAAIQSGFGAARDNGARRHEGVDIFAGRGTPVVAAADGWVTGSRTNRLGGNVVWLWSPTRGLTTYYAHLERQAVEPGERVHTGDVVGYVGNTGNARSTPPHLHFGIYRALGGATDPAPYICGAACGAAPVHRRGRTARVH